MLSIFEKLDEKTEKPELSYEKIKIISGMFNGHILSIEELQELYKEIAFKMLNNDELISREILLEKTDFDNWNNFKTEWSDCLRLTDKGYIRFN